MFLAAYHCLPRSIAGAALAMAALAMPLASWGQGSATAGAPGPAVLMPADQQPQYWFGVAVENIPPAFAKQLKIHPDQGVAVVSVFANSPAAKAGLRPDDLLIEINGRPLTSQEELARAANQTNTIPIGATKTPQPLMRDSTITYLRDGDRHTATLSPEQRPADLLVTGANTGRFTPNGTPAVRSPGVRDITISNGNRVTYGPGIQVDGSSQQDLTILKNAVGDGPSVIITQETDANGASKLTIRQGDRVYVVNPDKLEQLPESLQPFAAQFIKSQSPATPGEEKPMSTQQRLQQQSADIQELKLQNEELQRKIDLLLQAAQPAAQPGKAIPAPGK